MVLTGITERVKNGLGFGRLILHEWIMDNGTLEAPMMDKKRVTCITTWD